MRAGAQDAGGNEFGVHGVYHEVTPPLRIVDTFEFEGMPGDVMLEVADFRERGGGRRSPASRSSRRWGTGTGWPPRGWRKG